MVPVPGLPWELLVPLQHEPGQWELTPPVNRGQAAVPTSLREGPGAFRVLLSPGGPSLQSVAGLPGSGQGRGGGWGTS